MLTAIAARQQPVLKHATEPTSPPPFAPTTTEIASTTNARTEAGAEIRNNANIAKYTPLILAAIVAYVILRD